MTNPQCPNCEGGKLVKSLVPRYQARLGGIPFEIENARLWRCDSCDEIVVTAEDLKDWRKAQRAYLQLKGGVPSGDRVRRLRERLKLSAADLAALLAVTRQTVHAWEREGLQALQIGPAALLLLLLELETKGQANGVLAALITNAHRRGQATSITLPEGDGTSDRSAATQADGLHRTKARRVAHRSDRWKNEPVVEKDPRRAAAHQLILKQGSLWPKIPGKAA
jgi:putative zinc finger/helix-turn-helix YgiT family protein